MVHARYNPEQLTVLNIVPGLICIVLIMSTLFITTLSITRERERGTMENLLAMPVRPIEVMLAKIMPYIVIGYIQVVLIIWRSSALVFELPMRGSIPLLLLALGLFIASNLALGITFSTIASEPDAGDADGAVHAAAVVPAVRLHVPVPRLPVWAQWVGELFPITHALRIVRGMLLKGNGFDEILPELWPIAAFTLVVAAIAVAFYRETLD